MDCPYCGKLLATWWALERHIGVFHAPPPQGARSPEIPHQVADRSPGQDFNSDERTNVPSTKLDPCRNGRSRKIQECGDCGRVFRSRPALTYHTATKHPREMFSCPHCPQVFSHKSLLSSHVLRHGERGVICHRCGRRFFTQKQLNSHENLFHRRARSYSCKDCGGNYSTLRVLRHHARSHQSFTCHECGALHTHKHAHLTHLVSHGNRCTRCHRVFGSSAATLQHYRSLHGASASSSSSPAETTRLSKTRAISSDDTESSRISSGGGDKTLLPGRSTSLLPGIPSSSSTGAQPVITQPSNKHTVLNNTAPFSSGISVTSTVFTNASTITTSSSACSSSTPSISTQEHDSVEVQVVKSPKPGDLCASVNLPLQTGTSASSPSSTSLHHDSHEEVPDGNVIIILTPGPEASFTTNTVTPALGRSPPFSSFTNTTTEAMRSSFVPAPPSHFVTISSVSQGTSLNTRSPSSKARRASSETENSLLSASGCSSASNSKGPEPLKSDRQSTSVLKK